jgi:hypothetical protein
MMVEADKSIRILIV